MYSKKSPHFWRIFYHLKRNIVDPLLAYFDPLILQDSGYMHMRILTCACIRIFAHMHMFCMAIPSSNILTHQSHISQVIRKVKSAASLLERSEYKKNSVKFNNHPAYHQTSGFDIVVAYICNMHVEEAKQRSCCRLILGFQPWRGKTNDSDF